MHPKEAFLAELEHEAVATRTMLESLPEAKYEWRPHEKGKSMQELGDHIAGALSTIPQVLSAAAFDVAERPEPTAPSANREEMLKRFEEGLSQARTFLEGLGDNVADPWHLKRGDEVLMTMPRAAAVRSFLFNHLYHHRGQLSTYLRATGESVPSVYGPTADVNPFEA